MIRSEIERWAEMEGARQFKEFPERHNLSGPISIKISHLPPVAEGEIFLPEGMKRRICAK
jgi:hypothetical protein